MSFLIIYTQNEKWGRRTTCQGPHQGLKQSSILPHIHQDHFLQELGPTEVVLTPLSQMCCQLPAGIDTLLSAKTGSLIRQKLE